MTEFMGTEGVGSDGTGEAQARVTTSAGAEASGTMRGKMDHWGEERALTNPVVMAGVGQDQQTQ